MPALSQLTLVQLQKSQAIKKATVYGGFFYSSVSGFVLNATHCTEAFYEWSSHTWI